MSEQSVARGGLALYSAVVVNSVASFLFWVIVGRVLGASGVGAASALVSAAGVAVVLVSAGLQPAVIRETAARGEERPPRPWRWLCFKASWPPLSP